ncbi:MAG TPA: 50S ribosomal protein L25 [Nitrospirota bacterium]
MEKIALSVELRKETGKGPARRIRVAGKIPGVLYGLGDSTPITINKKELVKILNAGAGGSTLLSLNLGEKGEKMAVVRDYQLDPINSQLMHADLQEVSMGKTIHLKVHVNLVGSPLGVKEGGILEHLSREIEIACLPGNMPEHIDVEISALKINESIHVRDMKLPEGVKAITDGDTVVVTIAQPITAEKLEADLSAAVTAEVKEPELVVKKKEEEK